MEAARNLASEVLYDETKRAFATGGFSLVRIGTWYCPSFSAPRQVAVKSLQVGKGQSEERYPKLLKRLKRELRIWSGLSHNNIVPFLGYIIKLDIQDVALVSTYYKYGNIQNYLARHQDADRHLLFADVVAGLLYLHTRNPIIIHADIKPENILVNENGTAALCDFGLSVAVDDTPSDFSGSSLGAGSIRYMAPERLEQDFKPTTAIDVYALGCVCMEILFGIRPYAKCRTDFCVMAMIDDGVPPFHLQDTMELPNVLLLSWDVVPGNRPSTQELTLLKQDRDLLDSYRSILLPVTPSNIEPEPTDISVVPSRLHIRMELDHLERLPIPDLCDELVHMARHQSIRKQAAQLHGEDAIRLFNLLEECLIYPDHNLRDISELHTNISFRMRLDRLPDLSSTDLCHAVAQMAANEDYRWRAMELCNEDAIAIADAAQKCITDPALASDNQRAVILRLLQDVCSTSGELPTSYFLTGVEIDFRRRLGTGGRAMIYGGTFRDRQIAARDIIPGPDHRDGLVSREAVLHAQLHHPNILPFLGIHREPLDGHTLLISPFMRHGTATEYLGQLDEHKRTEVLPQILLGMAEGVAYLHRQNPTITHGNLHDSNILIDDNGAAAISGLGLSRIRHEVTRTPATVHTGGTIPVSMFRTSTKADVYSLAMVFYDLIVQEMPFGERNTFIFARGVGRRRPIRPASLPFSRPVNDQVWSLMEHMWAQQPMNRPSAPFVVTALKQIFIPHV